MLHDQLLNWNLGGHIICVYNGTWTWIPRSPECWDQTEQFTFIYLFFVKAHLPPEYVSNCHDGDVGSRTIGWQPRLQWTRKNIALSIKRFTTQKLGAIRAIRGMPEISPAEAESGKADNVWWYMGAERNPMFESHCKMQIFKLFQDHCDTKSRKTQYSQSEERVWCSTRLNELVKLAVNIPKCFLTAMRNVTILQTKSSALNPVSFMQRHRVEIKFPCKRVWWQ